MDAMEWDELLFEVIMSLQFVTSTNNTNQKVKW